MLTIGRLSPEDFDNHVKALADLLADAVEGGSSLGFTAPFGQDEAAAWWRTQRAAVAGGSLGLWVAGEPGALAGTVGLAMGGWPNGRHRAQVVKLMVHRQARGRGLGRALLATAEQAAVRAGVTLLMLDTETGSAADHLYCSAGWTRYGIVPGYASDPAGALQDCSFYYKRLAAG